MVCVFVNLIYKYKIGVFYNPAIYILTSLCHLLIFTYQLIILIIYHTIHIHYKSLHFIAFWGDYVRRTHI